MKSLLAVLLLIPVAGWADDPHHKDSGGDAIVGDIVGGSNSYSSKALAFGRSSFDVDIAQCRESVAWDTMLVGKQNVRLNPWCAAEVYDTKGMHHMAALMRCDIKEIKQHFPNDHAGCVTANTFVARQQEITASGLTSDADLAMFQAQEEEIEYLQEERDVMAERLDVLEARRRPQTTQQTPQSLYTDEQRDAITEIFK